MFGINRELFVTEGPQQTIRLLLPELVAYKGGFPLMLTVCQHSNKRESHLALTAPDSLPDNPAVSVKKVRK